MWWSGTKQVCCCACTRNIWRWRWYVLWPFFYQEHRDGWHGNSITTQALHIYIYIYIHTYHSVARGHRHREEAFIYLQRIHLVTNDSSTIRPTRWRSFYRVHWEHLDLEWCDHFVNNPPSFLALTLIHLQHWNLKTWPRGISYLESWCNKKNMNFQTNLIFWNHLVQE